MLRRILRIIGSARQLGGRSRIGRTHARVSGTPTFHTVFNCAVTGKSSFASTIARAALSVVLLLSAHYSVAQDAQSLCSEDNDRIYQIRIIERSSGKQAGLGSGFLVSADGLIVSNYHVVAEFTNYPDRYSVEFVSNSGEEGELALVNLDVVNDLALLRRADPPGYYIELGTALPAHGESIYSIGNPHDLGWTVIPGTYNGIAAHSVYERIHFSGSVNPGMSGGPVLNAAGKVIGVNVATAGNQLSFLVPLHRVAAFLERSPHTPLELDDIDPMIAGQLKSYQRGIVTEIIDRPWGSASFGAATIPREIAAFIKCWGYSDDDPEIEYQHTATTCSSEEQVYLSRNFESGNIVYQFNWLETKELNTFQFYNMLRQKIAAAYPDNDAGKEDVTDFVCTDDFVAAGPQENQNVVTKATFCVREYKKYSGLYDILYFGITVHSRLSALISHFTMSGVERDLGQAFTRKFIASIAWK